MVCWYCYWGWSEPVCKIYEKALAALDDCEDPLMYGPGHIVWSDENFGRDDVQWCLDLYDPDKFSRTYPNTTFEEMYWSRTSSYSDHDMEIVRKSLEELLALTDEELDPEPADYDGENPENYPPTVPVRKVA